MSKKAKYELYENEEDLCGFIRICPSIGHKTILCSECPVYTSYGSYEDAKTLLEEWKAKIEES